MHKRDVLHNGETQARTANMTASPTINAIEPLEYTSMMLWWNARSMILDRHTDLDWARCVRFELHGCIGAAVTNGIDYQIPKGLLQQSTCD